MLPFRVGSAAVFPSREDLRDRRNNSTSAGGVAPVPQSIPPGIPCDVGPAKATPTFQLTVCLRRARNIVRAEVEAHQLESDPVFGYRVPATLCFNSSNQFTTTTG